MLFPDDSPLLVGLCILYGVVLLTLGLLAWESVRVDRMQQAHAALTNDHIRLANRFNELIDAHNKLCRYVNRHEGNGYLPGDEWMFGTKPDGDE